MPNGKPTIAFIGFGEAGQAIASGLREAGLETMADSLESSLTVLRGRRTEQMKATTALGRAMLTFQYAFAIYCIYRIVTTTADRPRRLQGSVLYFRPSVEVQGYSTARRDQISLTHRSAWGPRAQQWPCREFKMMRASSNSKSAAMRDSLSSSDRNY